MIDNKEMKAQTVEGNKKETKEVEKLEETNTI